MKKYNNVEAMKIIKDLLNLVVKDKKRFIGLKNKFPKTIQDFKIKDEVVIEVTFTSIPHEIVLEELEEAITFMKKYAERSAKKTKELEAILALDVPVESGPKNVKVTKSSSGKLKKVIKEKINQGVGCR